MWDADNHTCDVPKPRPYKLVCHNCFEVGPVMIDAAGTDKICNCVKPNVRIHCGVHPCAMCLTVREI